AIGVRAIVSASFVLSAFERADFVEVFLLRHHRIDAPPVFTEQRFHFAFRPVLFTKLRTARSVLALISFEFFFVPRSWNQRSRFDQIFPLKSFFIEERSGVRLPRLDALSSRSISNR